MSCIKWRWIAWLIRLIGGVLIIIGVSADSDIMLVIGGIIAIVSGGISFNNWRCPSCNRMLSEQLPIFTEYCPHCGESLE